MFGGLVIGVIIEGHDGEWCVRVRVRVSSFLHVLRYCVLGVMGNRVSSRVSS